MFVVDSSTKAAKRFGNLLTKHRLYPILIAATLLYVLFLTVLIRLRYNSSFDELTGTGTNPVSVQRWFDLHHGNKADLHDDVAPARPSKRVTERLLSGLELDRSKLETLVAGYSELYRSAASAVAVGRYLWGEIGNGTEGSDRGQTPTGGPPRGDPELSCPNSASMSGSEFAAAGNLMVMPCGLTLGSSVTVVGKPRAVRNGRVSGESQFRVDLEGLRTVDGEDPPRVLHFNPRLKGDWSGRPVVEMNSCYRMQWGSSIRCQGLASGPDDETVDGKVKCEKWIQGEGNHLEETKATWWLNKLIGSRSKQMAVDWPFPFAEEKLFVLTISARLEGYHIYVDGRHVASFPYRTGFTLEDATGLSVTGDVDVHSVYAASLPSSHQSFAPKRSLEMSSKWRAPPLPKGEVELFIGILSAGNHFAERMAVRKSWMQHRLVQSSTVVARFFVALTARKEANAVLKKEAEFFGDIVIVPFLDSYDLVVLKTVAICEHGVRSMYAKYIMKCDDDTFINLDAVLNQARKIPEDQSFYIGNINYFHRPQRSGKWAVTYEEWPEENYPPYANGPGYIMSNDLANFTVSEFERNKLRLFKMEDVSMGMWVEKFNSTKGVKYVHDTKFCQFGCIEDYLTAHYQSPRQMLCLWERLQRRTRPQCCNMR